ncbi:hypothetical protein PENSPDRAFT_758936 [Peniophora sp. CONT]|nr:hypothetical protein PENSPDRAFT_758936 [Peniophora sp. CONT]
MARSSTMPNVPMNEDQQRDLVREVKRLRRDNRTLEQRLKLEIADYEKTIDDLREDLELLRRERNTLDTQLGAARLDAEQARAALEQENQARRIAESKNELLLASEARLGEEKARLQAGATVQQGRIVALNAKLDALPPILREHTIAWSADSPPEGPTLGIKINIGFLREIQHFKATHRNWDPYLVDDVFGLWSHLYVLVLRVNQEYGVTWANHTTRRYSAAPKTIL